jgi:hypothetical protein
LAWSLVAQRHPKLKLPRLTLPLSRLLRLKLPRLRLPLLKA